VKVLLIATNMESKLNNRMNAQPLPIGLAYIAGYIDKERHDVEMLDLMFSTNYIEDVQRTVEQFEPDVIGISLRNLSNHSYIDTKWAVPVSKEVISAIRKISAATIICGGPGFSVLPKSCFDFVQPDFGLTGDSGELFNSLICGIEDKSVDPEEYPGLVYSKHGETTIMPGTPKSTFSASPYFEGLDLDKYNQAGFGIGIVTQLLTNDSPLDQPTWRVKKPASEIIEEIKKLNHLKNFKKVFFITNAFNLEPDQSKQLCRNLIEENLHIHWSTVLSAGAPDEELLPLMKQAGCAFSIIVGDVLNAPRTSKGKNIFELCEENQLGYAVNQTFGSKGETENSVLKKIDWLKSITPTMAYLRVGVSIMPGTVEATHAIDTGLISSEDQLLEPHFYIEPEIKDWLLEFLADQVAKNPRWNLL
jgi:hypothetical protein